MIDTYDSERMSAVQAANIINQYRKELAADRERVERYRKALEAIWEGDYFADPASSHAVLIQKYKDIARAALTDTQEGK